ncbi:class I SAM-dependent methyltransferase [Actinoplanes sp. NPDC051470]|uniref:class I SAM-dependent methyltransferase n=1 Tax=Actinoplanes sp. NPDC051470 TaxID=3157224 RepID=UPI0034376A68
MSTAIGPEPDSLLGEVGESLMIAAVLAAADRLRVLDHLDRSPVDPAALVADGGLDQRSAPLLLAALHGLGLTTQDGDGRYRAGEPGLAAAAGVLLDMSRSLTEVLCTGRRGLSVDRRQDAERYYPAVVGPLGQAMTGPAGRAAALLAQHRPAYRDVLDLGAGAAPWSLAVARRLPACRVTALDLPGTLAMTRAAVTAAGLAGRYAFHAGDLFADPLPRETYDLVFAANLCHLFPAAVNRRLLRSAARLTRAGGTVAVIDILPDAAGRHRRAVALYALTLYARTSAGQLHTYDDHREWLTAAGFTGVRRTDVAGDLPLTMITAVRGPAADPGDE